MNLKNVRILKILFIVVSYFCLIHGMENDTKKNKTPEIVINERALAFGIAEQKEALLHLLDTPHEESWYILPKELRKIIAQYIIELALPEMQIFDSLAKLYTIEKGYKTDSSLKVIACMELKRFDILQTIFDRRERQGNRSDYGTSPYQYLVRYLENKNKNELKKLFDPLPADKESILKMALRMIYARYRDDDLDNLRLCSFLNYGGIHGDAIYLTSDWRFCGTLAHNLHNILALTQAVMMRKLTILYIKSNQLSTLPETVGWFKFQIIDLSENNFTQVPLVIKDCKNLIELRLYDNPLTALPLWFTECEWKEIGISVDEGVVIPWNKKDYPHIRIEEKKVRSI
jgi:hypothetical protein